MKTNTSKTLLCIAIAGVLFSPFAFAKEKLDLSAFKGNYNGTLSLVLLGEFAGGTSAVFFTVPKNGNSASITYNATASNGVATIPLTTVFALSANKTMSVTDLLHGLVPPTTKPGTGTWSQRKRSLTFSATNAAGDLFLTGTARAKDLRNKRKLTLTVFLAGSGDSATFTTTLRAKLPQRPRKPRR